MTTTAYELHDVKVGGSIKEDVLDEIFNIDPVDLAFTNRAGSSTITNDRYSWMEDELNPIDTSITREDASDSTGNDHVLPERVWNQSEMRTKIVAIGDRAQSVDSIGVASLMSDSIMKRNKELRKEYEASFLGDSASVTPSTGTAGRTGGVQSFITDHYYPGAGGSAGGFNNTTGVVDAPTHGTDRAMAESLLITAEEETYNSGGEPDVLLSSPAVIGKMAKFFASNSGASATLYSDVGTKEGGMRIKSAVKVYEGQFLTMELVASRELQGTGSGSPLVGAPVLGMDFDYWEVATLTGIHGYDLAKTGLYERKELMGDKGVKALNQKSSFCIADVDGSLDMIS